MSKIQPQKSAAGQKSETIEKPDRKPNLRSGFYPSN
jgi:hypothetical protein